MIKLKINLLPPEIKQKRETEKNLVILGFVTLIALAIFALVVVYVRLGISVERSRLESLESQNALLEAQIAQFKEFEIRRESFAVLKSTYENLSKRDISWYKMLIELALIIPENVTLKSITADKNTIQIEGDASSITELVSWIVRVDELTGVDDVWVDSLKVANGKVSFIVKGTLTTGGNSQ